MEERAWRGVMGGLLGRRARGKESCLGVEVRVGGICGDGSDVLSSLAGSPLGSAKHTKPLRVSIF